jgi:transposase-like protein
MSTEVRARTVLEVLSGRQTVAAAAAQLGVTRQTIYNWRAAFVAGGYARLGNEGEPATARGTERSTARLEATVVAIVDRLRHVAHPHEPSIATLEAVRTGAGLPVSRFCELVGIPRRTYYARRAAPDRGGPAAPAATRLDNALRALRARQPDWGARRIWRHLRTVDGLDVSLATVKRALARGS